MIGSSVGRYRIVDRLGGNMGQVFLADDPKLRRKVVLKKLSESLDEDPEIIRRLLHEARAAARLNHPHIAGIYDVLETSDSAYIVMEYVLGESLAARLQRGALSPKEALPLSVQVAGALEAAHAEGVIHRDLKPANIQLTPGGEAKILDFGLARTHRPDGQVGPGDTTSSGGDPLAGPGCVVGTLPYIPPEVFAGAASDQRGDIYSFGVTLFELLTGRLPFTGDTSMALIVAVTSGETPRASEINRAVPEELSAVIARAMARNPADRYQTAGELREDLRRVLAGRKRALRIAAGVATLAVAAVLALLARLPLQGRDGPAFLPRVVAVLPFLSIGPDSSSGYIAAGITDIIGTNLAALPLSVIPPGETSRYRAPDRDLKALSRELGASLVIDGSVQKYGDRLRITVRMMRSASSTLDWTRTFDGDVAEVLGLQQEIMDGLSGGLSKTGLLSAVSDAQAMQQLTRRPTNNEEAYADYIQARSFLERQDRAENILRAITLFESAWRKDTTFVQALGGLGEAHWAQYQLNKEAASAMKAETATRRASEKAPDDMAVRYSLAVILLGTGKLNEAETEITRIIKARPGSDAAHSLLGDLYDKQGRKSQAVREFQAALDMRPAYWWHHWRLGNVYLNYGRLPEAIERARRATQLQPDNPLGYQLLGTIYQAQGKTDEALMNYETSLKLEPTAAAYSNIGGKFFDDKDYVHAISFYRKAIELNSKLPVYRRNLGDALLELGRHEEANENFRLAIQLANDALNVNPRDSRTLALKALCLAKASQGDLALQAIALAIHLNPSSANTLYKKAAILALLKHEEEALQALKEALAAGLPVSFAAKDPDFRSISDSEEFRQLVSQ